jgi:hypothetical protein
MSAAPAKSRDDSSLGFFDSIFAIFPVGAARGVTQKPAPAINQGLYHD